MPRKLTGIRRRRNAWEVNVRVNGHLYTDTFPLTTPVQEMKDWRQEQRTAHGQPAHRPIDCRMYQPSRTWWIYFVQGDAHVKIGRTSNIPARLRALQVASPVALTLLATVREDVTTEAAIHRRFAHLRINGEWFQLGTDLQEFIESCAAN